MGNQRNRTLIGWWLVVWGVVLLLVSNRVLLGWEHIWPCILIVTGAVMLRVFMRRLTLGVVFAASWAILMGAFLTTFSSGALEWRHMRTLWPMIPFLAGTSFVVAGASRTSARGNAGVVVGALIIFMSVACFLYETGTVSERVAAPFLRFWPLVMVVAGVVLMKRGVPRGRADAADATQPDPRTPA